MRVLAALLVIGCAPTAQDYRPPRVTEVRPDDGPAPRGVAVLRRAMLEVHNVAREKAGMPPLAWNEDLAADAARWAAVLADTHSFKHSVEPRGKVLEGENLFMGTRGGYRYEEMAQYWIDESRNYHSGAFPDISTTGSWHDVGHYTQIIWKRTTDIGCSVSINDTDEYLVCRYGPPGNVWGRHAED